MLVDDLGKLRMVTREVAMFRMARGLPVAYEVAWTEGSPSGVSVLYTATGWRNWISPNRRIKTDWDGWSSWARVWDGWTGGCAVPVFYAPADEARRFRAKVRWIYRKAAKMEDAERGAAARRIARRKMDDVRAIEAGQL